MLKLIRLEWKKHSIGRYIRNAGIITLILTLFLFSTAFMGMARDPDTGVPDVADGYNSMSAPTEMFSSLVFLIFTGTMLASFIVSAYKNKTMYLMFSYPIKRQKILVSQMLAVWIFDFIALILAKLFIYGTLLIGQQFRKPDFPLDYNMLSPQFYLELILRSAITITISFIALFIGMAIKSSKAVIISSFILFFLLYGSIGGATLSHNMLFPLVLVVVSLVCAILSIITAEKKDLL